MNLRRRIQATSSIPPTAKLTTREVVNVVVVEFNAVSAFALGGQRLVKYDEIIGTYVPVYAILAPSLYTDRCPSPFARLRCKVGCC